MLIELLLRHFFLQMENSCWMIATFILSNEIVYLIFSCSISIRGIMILSNVLLCPLRKFCIDSDVCMLELICLTLTSLITFWYYISKHSWIPSAILCFAICFHQIIQHRYQNLETACIDILVRLFADFFWQYLMMSLTSVTYCELHDPTTILFRVEGNKIVELKSGSVTVPGIFMATILHHDATQTKIYFKTTLIAYLVGVSLLIYNQGVSKCEFPSTMLFVGLPCVFSTFAVAWWRGEIELLMGNK